jgi:hypothetical protein
MLCADISTFCTSFAQAVWRLPRTADISAGLGRWGKARGVQKLGVQSQGVVVRTDGKTVRLNLPAMTDELERC